MKMLLASMLFLVTATLQASVLKLAVITSEFDQNYMNFYIETDAQNNVHSMRYITTMPNGGIFEDISLPVETVINHGAVLVVKDNREAVRLNLENFSVQTGGTIKLSYLNNGITGFWQSKRLKLKLNAGRFSLYSPENALTNRLFLTANKVIFIGVVGVKDILTSYKPDVNRMR